MLEETSKAKWERPRHQIEVGRVMRHRQSGKFAVVSTVGHSLRMVRASGEVRQVTLVVDGRRTMVAGYAATEVRFAGAVVPLRGKFIAIAGSDDGPARDTEAEAQRDLDGMFARRLGAWQATRGK